MLLGVGGRDVFSLFRSQWLMVQLNDTKDEYSFADSGEKAPEAKPLEIAAVPNGPSGMEDEWKWAGVGGAELGWVRTQVGPFGALDY